VASDLGQPNDSRVHDADHVPYRLEDEALQHAGDRIALEQRVQVDGERDRQASHAGGSFVSRGTVGALLIRNCDMARVAKRFEVVEVVPASETVAAAGARVDVIDLERPV